MRPRLLLATAALSTMALASSGCKKRPPVGNSKKPSYDTAAVDAGVEPPTSDAEPVPEK